MESIIKGLAEAYPEAECELSVATPIQLLVATILSAQATDKMVNTVTPSLFKRYPDVEAFATAGVSELEELIRTIGLFRAKARNIIKASQAIVQDHGGVVPDDLDALVTLAGVGRKTANCVLVNAFGKPGIMCDTHCCRLSQRIGLTEQTHPDKIEAALAQLMPPEQWGLFSHRIIWHGRRVCHARKPNCGDCNLLPFCDYGQNV
jgi:endonuclease-3